MKPRAKKKNRKVPCIGCAKDVNRSDAKFCLLDNELFKQFLKELDEAPDYVKDILYVQLVDGSVPQNEALTVDIVMINDKHITITSGKKAEAKEIYEKIKKRLFLDNLNNLTL